MFDDHGIAAGLYVIPTPLGNLEDISIRAQRILQQVQWIAAEDTRHTRPLMLRIGANAPLIAAHQFNEHSVAARIIELIQAGDAVALVSDAGTPAISDPGALIVADVRRAGLPITALPGACAFVTALSAAGIACPHSLFYGFLPNRSSLRKAALQPLRTLPYTLILYEAPHRIIDMLEDMRQIFGGERPMVLAKEISKIYETYRADSVAQMIEWLLEDPLRQKGEFVLLFPPLQLTAVESDTIPADILEHLRWLLIDENLTVKQSVGLLERLTSIKRKSLYAAALKIKAVA